MLAKGCNTNTIRITPKKLLDKCISLTDKIFTLKLENKGCNMQNNPTYYAILTAEVRYCPELSAQEKLLYAEITALSNKDGFCKAGNDYFAKLYSCTTVTVSRQIKNLEDHGFLHIEYDKNGAKVTQRRMFTINKNVNGNDVTVNKNVNGTINKNVKENNTSNINITRLNNITDKSVQLLNMFIAGLKRNNPKIDRTDKQKAHYLDIFDEMLKTYEYIEIARMITFAFNSDFWSQFILSADKLQQHQETLYAQSKNHYAISSDQTDGEVEF